MRDEGALVADPLVEFAEPGAACGIDPEAEGPEDVDRVVAALPGAGVLALCETARGVLAAPEIAAHSAVVALMWGGEDLIRAPLRSGGER